MGEAALGAWTRLRERRRARRAAQRRSRARSRELRIGIVTAYTTRKGIFSATRAAESAIRPAPEIFPTDELRHLDGQFEHARAAKVDPTLWHERVVGPGTRLLPWLESLDVAIFMERVHPSLFRRCQDRGIRTVLLATLDYLPATQADLARGLEFVDLVVFTSEQGPRVLRELGHENVAPVVAGLSWSPRHAEPSSDGCTFYFNVGNFGGSDRRCVPMVLETFNTLLPQYPRARLRIKMLTPPRRHHPDFARLHERIEVIEGRLSPAEMIALQAQADVSLFPTRVEGVGYPMLESLALGVPVVTTDAPPMNEFVREGETGLLVRAKETGRFGQQLTWDPDPAHFRAQIERLLGPEGPALRSRLAESAAREAQARQSGFGPSWQAALRRVTPRYVNVGAGDAQVAGALNVDVRALPGIDVVADARRLPFRDGSIDRLMAEDLIEHFPIAEVDDTLTEWLRVLRPGGRIRVQTPDLRALARAFLRGRLTTSRAVEWFYGGQDHPFNFHMAGFDEALLRELLTEHGADEIVRRREGISSKNMCLEGRKRAEV